MRAKAQPRYVPLFWRLFIPNATVLAVASIVLMVEPAHGRVAILAAGLAVMLAVNLVLMRSALAPVTRLTHLMRHIDPLRPGHRVTVRGPASEVTVLAEAFNDMLDRLESERRQAGRLALEEREAERLRVARELHDEIGQSLTALGLELERVRLWAPLELQDDLGAARDHALATLDEVRAVIRRLRPEALDDLGLVPALTILSNRLSRQTGLNIETHLEHPLPALPNEVELVLYRVAQESLTNVVRHAHAQNARLQLERFDGALVLRVSDDGIGPPAAASEGAGIRGMRERAMLVGARLSLLPGRRGRGTDVVLELTLDG